MAAKKRRREKGQGSVYPQPGSPYWYMSYWVNGKRKTASTKQTEEADARVVLAQKNLEISLAYPNVPATEGDWTFEEVATKWLNLKLASGSQPGTKNELRIIVDNHLIPAFGSKDLHEIDVEKLTEFLSAKLNGVDFDGNKLPVKGGSSSKKQSVAYTRRQMQVLKAIFEYAQTKAYFAADQINPVTQVDVGVLRSNRSGTRRAVLLNEVLEADELRKLFDTATDDWEELLYRLAGQLGLRIGEILALRASDYNRKTKTLSIQRTQRRNPNVAGQNTELRVTRLDAPHIYASEDGTKTNAGQRTITLSDELDEKICRQIDSKERKKRLTSEDWLFPSRTGTMISPGTLRKHRWPKARKDAGLGSKVTFHTLRHSFASHQIARGIPITKLSYWLGHANAHVTYSIYAHILKSQTQDVAALDLSIDENDED